MVKKVNHKNQGNQGVWNGVYTQDLNHPIKKGGLSPDLCLGITSGPLLDSPTGASPAEEEGGEGLDGGVGKK